MVCYVWILVWCPTEIGIFHSQFLLFYIICTLKPIKSETDIFLKINYFSSMILLLFLCLEKYYYCIFSVLGLHRERKGCQNARCIYHCSMFQILTNTKRLYYLNITTILFLYLSSLRVINILIIIMFGDEFLYVSHCCHVSLFTIQINTYP